MLRDGVARVDATGAVLVRPSYLARMLLTAAHAFFASHRSTAREIIAARQLLAELGAWDGRFESAKG